MPPRPCSSPFQPEAIPRHPARRPQPFNDASLPARHCRRRPQGRSVWYAPALKAQRVQDKLGHSPAARSGSSKKGFNLKSCARTRSEGIVGALQRRGRLLERRNMVFQRVLDQRAGLLCNGLHVLDAQRCDFHGADGALLDCSLPRSVFLVRCVAAATHQAPLD